MIKEKQRLIDVIAAKLSARRNEYFREGDNIGIVMGNCLAAEEIIIRCKEIIESELSIGSVKKLTRRDELLDDIDYFLNKEADS